jgi:hypothetical protein
MPDIDIEATWSRFNRAASHRELGSKEHIAALALSAGDVPRLLDFIENGLLKPRAHCQTCMDCGGQVGDEETHRDWHRRLPDMVRQGIRVRQQRVGLPASDLLK